MSQTSANKYHEEWTECRQTIARFDTILIDLRKYGFTIITGLLTAGSFLGFDTPTASLQVGVIIVTMVLIVILYWMDIYYQNLLYGAVLRAIFLEIFRLERGLSKYVSGLYGRSGMGWLLHFLYGGFFIAAFILGMFAATISENPQPPKPTEVSNNKINITSLNSTGVTVNLIGNNTIPPIRLPTNADTSTTLNCNLIFDTCEKYVLYVSAATGIFAMFLIFLLCDQVRSYNFKIIFRIMRFKSRKLPKDSKSPTYNSERTRIVDEVEDYASMMLLERLSHNIIKTQYKLWRAYKKKDDKDFLKELRKIFRPEEQQQEGVLKSINKKKIIIIIIIAVIAISVGLYAILPLFTNTVVDEPIPTASGISSAAHGIQLIPIRY